jgi:hypothetical protein
MPRASTYLRTTKTSGAVISLIGRDPSAGSTKLMNHSNFRNVAAAFPSRRFLSARTISKAAPSLNRPFQAPAPLPARGFLPWSLSDAGPKPTALHQRPRQGRQPYTGPTVPISGSERGSSTPSGRSLSAVEGPLPDLLLPFLVGPCMEGMRCASQTS